MSTIRAGTPRLRTGAGRGLRHHADTKGAIAADQAVTWETITVASNELADALFRPTETAPSSLAAVPGPACAAWAYSRRAHGHRTRPGDRPANRTTTEGAR